MINISRTTQSTLYSIWRMWMASIWFYFLLLFAWHLFLFLFSFFFDWNETRERNKKKIKKSCVNRSVYYFRERKMFWYFKFLLLFARFLTILLNSRACVEANKECQCGYCGICHSYIRPVVGLHKKNNEKKNR